MVLATLPVRRVSLKEVKILFQLVSWGVVI